MGVFGVMMFVDVHDAKEYSVGCIGILERCIGLINKSYWNSNFIRYINSHIQKPLPLVL